MIQIIFDEEKDRREGYIDCCHIIIDDHGIKQQKVIRTETLYELLEKKEVRMPDELKAIVKCANPKCITNNEPMATLFHVIDKDNCVIKCHYCEKEQKREDITII